jgi:uncharacterized protein YggU (UPF0235/DUF167 family)
MEYRVKVSLGKREEIREAKDGSILAVVDAPRKEGKANQRLRELIAEHFGVPPAAVTIVRGHSTPGKTVRVGGSLSTR